MFYQGINTAPATYNLNVNGTSYFGGQQIINGASNFKYVDGNQGANKVLTSDANGVGSWQNAGGAKFLCRVANDPTTCIGTVLSVAGGTVYYNLFGTTSIVSHPFPYYTSASCPVGTTTYNNTSTASFLTINALGANLFAGWDINGYVRAILPWTNNGDCITVASQSQWQYTLSTWNWNGSSFVASWNGSYFGGSWVSTAPPGYTTTIKYDISTF